MKLYFIVIILVVLNTFSSVVASHDSVVNSTNDDVLSRNKRFLIYVPNGGTLKFVTGMLYQIYPYPEQDLKCFRNFQYQYTLPAQLIYPNVSSFPGLFSRSQKEGRGFGSMTQIKIKPDSSRKIAYRLVEKMLNREGKNGRECLLRTICEVAETPVNHNGLVGELLQLFFTPGEHEKLHQDYHHARKVGLNHVNCEKMFPDCPSGHGILDSISLIEEFKFQNWLKF